jgi:hypothetical protein
MIQFVLFVFGIVLIWSLGLLFPEWKNSLQEDKLIFEMMWPSIFDVSTQSSSTG